MEAATGTPIGEDFPMPEPVQEAEPAPIMEKQEQPPTPTIVRVPHGSWALTLRDTEKDEMLYIVKVEGPVDLEVTCA